MWQYDKTVTPPAPFLDVLLRSPTNAALAITVPAKIDTAADITAIPETALESLRLQAGDEIPVSGYDGRLATVHTYFVILEVAQARFRIAEVVVTPERYALLGRDVLNHFYTHLHGPDLTFDLSLSPSD